MKKQLSLSTLQEHYHGLLQSETGILPAPIIQSAQQTFTHHGLPNNRHEHWKYTSLSTLYAAQIASLNASNYQPEGLPLNNIKECIIVSAVGQKVIGELPKGMQINFHTKSAPNNQAEQSITRSNTLLSKTLTDDPMLALNQAFCRLVISITVDKNLVVEQPIFIDYGNNEAASHNENPHIKAIQTIVTVGQSAEATVVEYHRNATSQQELSLITCSFDLAENANCQHYSLTNQHNDNQHFWYGYGSIAKHANLQSSALVKGEQLARRFFCNDLNGDGAQVSVNSAYLGYHTDTLDVRTLTRHLQPHCQSMQLHQGLLDDSSNGVFNGMIYVDPKALQTDGQMDNNVMLLTPTAQNNSKPQLEIYADDVKCSHGFTCGAIDENQLYYMRSRGIPEHIARKHILKAFVAQVTENFPAYLTL